MIDALGVVNDGDAPITVMVEATPVEGGRGPSLVRAGWPLTVQPHASTLLRITLDGRDGRWGSVTITVNVTWPDGSVEQLAAPYVLTLLAPGEGCA